MVLTWTIGFAYRPGSDPELDAEVLQALLECYVTINRAWRRRNPKAPLLYNAGVRYGRVRCPDGSLGPWESTPDAYASRVADCKVLAAIRVAELREQGVRCRPVFRTLKLTDPTGRVKKSTHILVEKEVPSGILRRTQLAYECPSAKLGMHEYFAAQGITAMVLP